jgi:S-DNA-T family DNA segregation ATPase FtsK/SpoIIIE
MGARPLAPPAAGSASLVSSPEATARVSSTGARRSLEAAALLLWALAVFLGLALGSYCHDARDPTVVGPEWVGPAGAALAAVLVRGFGLVAWCVPLELSALGLSLFGYQRARITGLRVAGDLVVGIVLSALVHVAAPDSTAFGRMPSGGNVGLLFGELLEGLFSTAGSFLVGGTVVGLILIGRSSFSLQGTFHRAQRSLGAAAHASRGVYARLMAAWGEAHRLREERQRSEQASAVPKIDARPTDETIVAQLRDSEPDWILSEAGGEPLTLAFAPDASALGPIPVGDADEALVRALSETPDPQDTPSALVIPGAEATEASESVQCGDSGSSRPRGRQRSRAPTGPRIIDTKPAQATERAKAALRAPESTHFKLPPTALLEMAPAELCIVDEAILRDNARLLEKTLADYGISARVTDIRPGPTVTTYEVVPEAGTKVSKVASLMDDLALALSRKVRIIAPIPGKSRIGFELPNDRRPRVYLRDLVEHKEFARLAEDKPLPVVLGRDIVGTPFYADLASMPHVIVAGATGAGKSVGLNVMLASLLFCRTPEELRLLMVDPKVVELAPFDRIPHLLLPVVTDMKQAATALRWAVDEMERRYQLFADAGTRNITTYNTWADRVIRGEIACPDPTRVAALAPGGEVVMVPRAREGGDGLVLPGKLPHIVIVVDEFADLMIQQGKEVEACVARLAQKARAAGMHVVLATQRPSVDVITGMIKANFPTRIAFRVSQRVDSRTILDEQGAELLLGKGDMLVKMNGLPDTLRVQCPFISEEEVSALTDFLRAQGAPEYHQTILERDQESEDLGPDEPLDGMFEEAVQVVAATQRCSTSWLQRKLGIGYNRAAKMVELMEKRGYVGPPNGAKDREVLLPPP